MKTYKTIKYKALVEDLVKTFLQVNEPVKLKDLEGDQRTQVIEATVLLIKKGIIK